MKTKLKASPFVTQQYEHEQEAKKDYLEERAAKKREQSSESFKRSHTLVEHIPVGQPILVGHHSEKHHRNTLDKSWAAIGKSVALDDEATKLESRAAGVGSGGIASNDPQALQKLNMKLEGLIRNQETMKAVNKIIRRKNLTKAEKIAAIVSDERLNETLAKERLEPDCFGGIGFAQYTLRNNNVNIHSTKKRIASLERIRNSAPIEFENDDFSMRIADGFVVIDFVHGKPVKEVRILIGRTYSFNFKRTLGVWRRKVTANCLSAAVRLLKQLQDIDVIY